MKVKNKKITLIGKINIFGQNINRESSEIDTVSNSSIVYPDLVFTLKEDNSKYHRPRAKYNGKTIDVVSNKLFFLAAREAGFQEIMFDLHLERNMPLEEIMQELGLRFPEKAREKEGYGHFIFLRKGHVKGLEKETDEITINPKSSTEEYQNRGCLNYSVSGNSQLIYQKEREFLDRVFRCGGKFRSIDGVIKRGPFKRYF